MRFDFLSIALSMGLLVGCGNQQTEVAKESNNDTPTIIEKVTDPFVGCYSEKENSPATIKVTKNQKGYFIALKKKDKWEQEESPLTLADKSDPTMVKLLKTDVDNLESALYFPKGTLALFKFKHGAKVNGKSLESDYMVFFFLAAGPVFQTSCK